MPSGKRVRITIDKVLYDMSPEQFEILGKKGFTLKIDAPYNQYQRAEGLATKKLFTATLDGKGGTKYARTPLGSFVLREINKRLKAEV